MAEIILNETVTIDYTDPVFGGDPVYVTHHTYGCQIHRSRYDAERWNEGQRDIRPAR